MLSSTITITLPVVSLYATATAIVAFASAGLLMASYLQWVRWAESLREESFKDGFEASEAVAQAEADRQVHEAETVRRIPVIEAAAIAPESLKRSPKAKRKAKAQSVVVQDALFDLMMQEACAAEGTTRVTGSLTSRDAVTVVTGNH